MELIDTASLIVERVDNGQETAKVVYRVGDRVKIIVPRFVLRVGYPLTWPALRPEVEADPRTRDTAALWGVPDGGKAYQDLVSGICRALVRVRGFGGKERSIYTITQDSHLGQIGTVTRRRTVLTGTYSAPGWQSGGYYGESEYEPGYLDKSRARVLLLTEYGEIERCYVEKYEPKQGRSNRAGGRQDAGKDGSGVHPGR